MAYCLRSFVQILEEVLHPDQYHKNWVLDHDKIPQVQTLWETASFLRDFLDNSSPLIQERIANLEDQIMDAAKKAEDTLESYITSRLVSSPSPEDQVSRIKSWTWEEMRNSYKSSFSKIFKYIYPQGQTFPKLGDAFTISPPNLGDMIQVFEDAKQEVIKFMDACQRPDESVPLTVPCTRYPNHNNLVVGVTEDLNQLRSRLTSQASKLHIIPIVGMGGMGKTTLAQILYNQFSSSNSHFDCLAWATMSQSYNTKLVLRTLLASVTGKNLDEISDKQATSELIVTLYKALRNRRYLIVLDDIWSTKAWDDVQRAFSQDNEGSRIILTTRENIVADYVKSKYHEMHLIDENDSWELLRGKVFGNESCPREFEEVGKNIASSCGGLPLALQVIGGFLSQSHKSIDFWEHVANNVRSLIMETDNQFSGIFSWSFAHLPHYLKPCFLYMAGFPEGSEISASKLTKLWVSEGFLYPIRDRSLEEAAMIHLNALVDRNLIFVRGRGRSGRAKSFGIHNLLRDLCLRKAEEKKFLYFHAFQAGNHQEDIGRIVSAVKNPPVLTPLTRSYRSTTRTFYTLQATIKPRVGLKLSLLRVLDLESLYFDKFPGGVVPQFVNLRYLHINSNCCTPVSLSVLRNLQTLIVRRISYLALIISDMPQLRHLVFFDMKEYSKLEYGVHENLQSLFGIPAKEVRKLLGKLPNLRKLTFECHNDKEFIDLTCFQNLKTVTCFRNKFTNGLSMTLPVSLRKLTLEFCIVGQSLLDAIGALPNLQNLILCPNNKTRMDWEPCEGGFRELKYLEIYKWNLMSLLATEDHFPVLEHLVLIDCEYLIEIPNDFGSIETLKIIEVYRCLPSVIESARRIYEDQCQLGNTLLQLRLGVDHVELRNQEKEKEEKRGRKRRRKTHTRLINFSKELMRTY